jgi:uncharacterized iron-regulated membrane protein
MSYRPSYDGGWMAFCVLGLPIIAIAFAMWWNDTAYKERVRDERNRRDETPGRRP